MSGSLYTHWHYTDYSCTPFPIPAPRVPVPFYSRYRNSRVVLTDLKSDLPLERRASSETSCVVSTPYSCTEDSRGSSALSGLRTPSSTRSTSSSTFDAIRGSGRDDIRARNRFIDRGRRAGAFSVRFHTRRHSLGAVGRCVDGRAYPLPLGRALNQVPLFSVLLRTMTQRAGHTKLKASCGDHMKVLNHACCSSRGSNFEPPEDTLATIVTSPLGTSPRRTVRQWRSGRE